MTLREARGFINWTQARLAQAVGSTVSTISDLENGGNENPGYQLVMRIVKALQGGGLTGISAEDIFPVVDVPAEQKPAERRSRERRKAVA